MATTTGLPAGIYHIVAGGTEYLTHSAGNRVTILPPSNGPDQEWQITPSKDGNIIITIPSKIIPASYLSYRGAPNKPQPADQIVYFVSEFPPNEWQLGFAPGINFSIRVAGSDLGIKISPAENFPPILDLGSAGQLEWVFDRIRGE